MRFASFHYITLSSYTTRLWKAFVREYNERLLLILLCFSDVTFNNSPVTLERVEVGADKWDNEDRYEYVVYYVRFIL